MTAYLTSLMIVVLAEMGDKTQLLAMAFATRFRWQTVMWGVFIATVLNHFVAVLLGSYLTRLIPMQYIQIITAASFILFGLWTIRGDQLNGEDKATKFSPFWTVAIAFFIAEMGDKTQFATVALAAQFNTIIPVWMGTTSGMMIADGMGIIFGMVLGRKIPERIIKWFAAISFILFGLFGLYESLPKAVLNAPLIVLSVIILIVSVYLVNRMGGTNEINQSSKKNMY